MTASLFFSSCAEDGGIYHYILQNGKLTLRSFTPCDRPMYTITEKKQLWVILRDCFDDHTSGLQEYKILDSGTLMPIGEPVSTKGIVACHLCGFHGKIMRPIISPAAFSAAVERWMYITVMVFTPADRKHRIRILLRHLQTGSFCFQQISAWIPFLYMMRV